MSLKILLSGDLHIGMKFNGYPENLRQQLTEARFQVLDRLIEQANENECHLLVIAGDLFDKTTVPARDVERVAVTLDKFAGDCVLVMPGNHDYDNGMSTLWSSFKKRLSGKTVLLNEFRPYYLQEYDLDVAVYPAPCQRKHSGKNNLGWMAQQIRLEAAKWYIGIAHGSLEGLSPDLNQEYFPMKRQELEALDLDLWLLGHAHIPYPAQHTTNGQRIFNAGVPEPDGMDCQHEGHAWLLEVADDKEVQGRLLTTGIFRFLNECRAIESADDLEALLLEFSGGPAERTILRLELSGVLPSEVFARKEEYYRKLSSVLANLQIEDTRLRVRISPEIIEQEFTAGSFPYRFLNEFLARGDQDALQLAYEMLREVKKA